MRKIACFRFLFCRIYFRQKHLHLIGNKTRVNLMYFFYFMDILALLGLTYVQSNEWFIIHAISFGTFLTASPLFMITGEFSDILRHLGTF